ncbi:NUDIX domain protein [Piedraia hortae CBS 480.64]|uniref:NUDIX domain protein n=1 Tax=Piedraia hortae CBS 480.64 TaxID=1314780 RepID=A0A6A7BT06_9PEZI|nr:NUDIX domain protein [Piedraia hortae CBS 480.64]
MSSALSPTSKAALSKLRSFAAPTTNWHKCPASRRAAVLILLYPGLRGELRVVLTLRSAGLKSYAGQVALPGGKVDDEKETPFVAARREAFEEIGLPMRSAAGDAVEEITEMPSHLAMTELAVRPCVAFMPHNLVVENESVRLEPNPDEVAAIFTAPFENFLKVDDMQDEGVEGQWYKGAWHDWLETKWRMHEFFVPVEHDPVIYPRAASASLPEHGMHTEGSVTPNRWRVFGMTARILVDCARVAYGYEPEFEHNDHCGDEELVARLLRIGRLKDKEKEKSVLTRSIIKKAVKL